MSKSKTIVTHINPDFDGIPAIWLLHRFHPDFSNAKVDFVPAGSTFKDAPVESDSDIVHVDTGGGPFDHHDTSDYTCAAQKVWEWIKKERNINDQAVDRIVSLATFFDHAKELEYKDAVDDKYDLMAPAIINGWKMVYPGQNEKVVALGEELLDAIYKVFTGKVEAEKIISKARKFATRWGKSIASESHNDMIMHLGEKMGYSLVVRKDPKKGNLRIYGRKDKGVDLTEVYGLFLKKDPDAHWFLHSSKCLLLNGSGKRPGMSATKITLDEAVEILKSV